MSRTDRIYDLREKILMYTSIAAPLRACPIVEKHFLLDVFELEQHLGCSLPDERQRFYDSD